MLAAKQMLLQCATPESVLRVAVCNLPESEKELAIQTYFYEQHHGSLQRYLDKKLANCNKDENLTLQVLQFYLDVCNHYYSKKCKFFSMTIMYEVYVFTCTCMLRCIKPPFMVVSKV